MSMGANLDENDSDGSLISEINVTPMVDIMLVLLIIFMVTAPLLTQGVDVNLPSTESTSLTPEDEPLLITVDRDGTPFIEKNSVSIAELTEKITAIRKNKPELPIFVRGDKDATYGAVMTVMSQLQQAGVDRVGLVTDPLP